MSKPVFKEDIATLIKSRMNTAEIICMAVSVIMLILFFIFEDSDSKVPTKFAWIFLVVAGIAALIGRFIKKENIN